MANRSCKTKGRALRATQSIDLRTRSLEIGTASAFTAWYPDTKSSMNQRPGFTIHRLRRELVEIASALLHGRRAPKEKAQLGWLLGDILHR